MTYDYETWDDESSDTRLADGELPDDARRALMMLLQRRFITQAKNRGVWETILRYRTELSTHLANMFLDLVIDEFYGIAFKRQSRTDDALVVLKQERISREVSFLLIHLRKLYTYWDGSDEPVVVPRDELEEFIRPLLRESGNQERTSKGVDAAINGAIALNLLSQRTDVDYLYEVSPAIVPLIGDEEFRALEQLYRQTGGAPQSEVGADPDAETTDDKEAVA